jgi:anti-anti-sigma regulatory factor
MLRIDTKETDTALLCRLEGRLTGEGAEQVRLLATRCSIAKQIVIDVTEMLYADCTGEEVLQLLKQLGAHFIAETSYARHVCERLDLPQACSK